MEVFQMPDYIPENKLGKEDLIGGLDGAVRAISALIEVATSDDDNVRLQYDTASRCPLDSWWRELFGYPYGECFGAATIRLECPIKGKGRTSYCDKEQHLTCWRTALLESAKLYADEQLFDGNTGEWVDYRRRTDEELKEMEDEVRNM